MTFSNVPKIYITGIVMRKCCQRNWLMDFKYRKVETR